MPIIEAKLIKGRTAEQKKKFVEAVTKASIETLGGPPHTHTVILYELEHDMIAHAGVLFKDEKK